MGIEKHSEVTILVIKYEEGAIYPEKFKFHNLILFG